MQLKFLGRGSGFNMAEGNTSAFYKNQQGNMILFDCGESVFKTIKENNVLNQVNNLFVVISHTHTDHIGSLGNLCLFNFFACKQKTNIVLSGHQDLDDLIKKALEVYGLTDTYVNLVTVSQMLNNFPEIQSFEYVKAPHVEELPSYSFLITSPDNSLTYYSADTNDGSFIKQLLNSGKQINAMYVDTCKADYPGNVHLSAKILAEIVPTQLRHKVWCMHIDNSSFIPELEAMGFNVVDHNKDLKA